MGKKVVVVKQITAPKGTEGFVDLMKVNEGQTLKVTRAVFDFPEASRGYVYTAIYKGFLQTIPDDGLITTYAGQIPVNTEKYWESGTRLRIYYKNTDGSADHSFLVAVEGEYQ